MSYQHRSLEERHYIELSLKNEITLTDIANSLDRSQSTISREVARNTGQKGYRHKQADRMAQERHTVKYKSSKLTAEITDMIEDQLRQDWSPEQIAGRLKRDGVIKLHYEAIYPYILSDKRSGGDLYTLFVISTKPPENAMEQHITVGAYPIERILMNDPMRLIDVNG